MEPIGAAALYDNISLPYFSIGGAMLILLVSLPAAAVLGFLSGARRRQVLIKTGRPVDQVARINLLSGGCLAPNLRVRLDNDGILACHCFSP